MDLSQCLQFFKRKYLNAAEHCLLLLFSSSRNLLWNFASAETLSLSVGPVILPYPWYLSWTGKKSSFLCLGYFLLLASLSGAQDIYLTQNSYIIYEGTSRTTWGHCITLEMAICKVNDLPVVLPCLDHSYVQHKSLLHHIYWDEDAQPVFSLLQS